MREISSLLVIVLAACTSQAQMDATPPQRVVRVNENYQAVFQKLNKGMRTCSANAFRVDGQLYSELGYGEITLAADGLTSSSPLMYARVSKNDTGSTEIEFKSLTAMSPDGPIGWMQYWAGGGTRCPAFSLAEQAPS